MGRYKIGVFSNDNSLNGQNIQLDQ